MTKKDYKKFAHVFSQAKEVVGGHELSTVKYLQEEIMGIFTDDNSNFDRKRFYVACEPEKN